MYTVVTARACLLAPTTYRYERLGMIGWSVHIKHNDETILFAESADPRLDQKIRERAESVLGVIDEPSLGYGYPNRYLIRNSQLPVSSVYRLTNYSKTRDTNYKVKKESFVLRPFAHLDPDETLWVELWDLS